MSLIELAALQHLRLYRAERAEGAVHAAQRALRALGIRIEQAHTIIEQARRHEEQQRVELLGRYQGHAVSPRVLTDWSEQERKVSAATVREEGVLQALLDQQRQQVVQLESARKQAAECQRQVEKLRELSALLTEQDL